MSEMIYDRTNEDVLSASKILNEKVKKGLAITDEERQTIEKGTVTIDTLNRIEDSQKKLFELFLSMGYQTKKIESKHWENGQIFYLSDLERIIKNCATLKKSFFVYKGTVEPTSPRYEYKIFNEIEKIIDDMERISQSMIENYRFCGNYYCGEDS